VRSIRVPGLRLERGLGTRFSYVRAYSFLAKILMSSAPPQPVYDVAADRFVRRLEVRYLVLLAAVAVALLLDQALVQPGLASLNSYAPAINMAGRQRMLSQRIAKSALALLISESVVERAEQRQELSDSLEAWITAHRTLFADDAVPQIGHSTVPELTSEAALLENRFKIIRQATETLLQETPVDDSAERLSPAAQTAVRVIQANEGEFLRSMDRIVGLLEAESDTAVKKLRYLSLAISAGILCSLLAIGRWVLRPATLAMRIQVLDQEQQIAARTAELAATNVSLLQEIQDREAAEHRSQQLSAQLAHAGRVSTLAHLSTGLAHELNQPLAAIVNYAEACRVLGTSPEFNREALERHLREVHTSAMLASRIVRRMRDFTSPHSAEQICCELHPLIREVAALMRIELERAEVNLVLRLEAEQAIIMADPIQIQQVLVNLIHNATQAIVMANSAVRRITIQTLAAAGQLELTVADTGPGLSAALQETIFEPFVTSKADGMGLGLFICRCIVEQHQGKIHAESTTSGTLLRVTLPLALSDQRESADSADSIYR
jgi:two-component system, LuxR family, sensor kinase FixL